MRAVTNLPNRKEETTQFTFFFTTVGNGKFAPVKPTVNAKATKAKAFESASTYLPKELGKRGPKLPSRLAPSKPRFVSLSRLFAMNGTSNPVNFSC